MANTVLKRPASLMMASFGWYLPILAIGKPVMPVLGKTIGAATGWVWNVKAVAL